MKCPVCGDDCVEDAPEMVVRARSIFKPCLECTLRPRNKEIPPGSRFYRTPCRCGKRFIDEVFVHIYVLMLEEGLLSGSEPLKAVGSPLVHPGFVMQSPPFLPASTLVLLSRFVNEGIARRIMDEVPEVRGVVRCGDFTPGLVDPMLKEPPRVYDLLAGCDVRANIFENAAGPLVLYQQQSRVHIEYPRASNLKIRNVEARVDQANPFRFVDAACGVGTLGLTAASLGVPHVVMNDAWADAAFWSGWNLRVNRESFDVNDVKILVEHEDLLASPVGGEPRLVAETTGSQDIVVYHGDMFRLGGLAKGRNTLACLDLFDKRDTAGVQRITDRWAAELGGEVLIP